MQAEAVRAITGNESSEISKAVMYSLPQQYIFTDGYVIHITVVRKSIPKQNLYWNFGTDSTVIECEFFRRVFRAVWIVETKINVPD